MKYCKYCLQPDTRPGTKFLYNKICPACKYHKSTLQVQWSERLEILENIFKKNKSRINGVHDCIIGVSGGKDSTRQALWVKEKFNINPLLVCLSYPPNEMSEIGAANLSNLINAGFDVLVKGLEPITWKKLLKISFLKFSNCAVAPELALFASVPKIAMREKIKLILWGENPALQVGDSKTLGKKGFDGNNLRYSNTLMSGHKWMVEEGFSKKEINEYIYPSKANFKKMDINIIYLGWFMGDWSLLKNSLYSTSYGLKTNTTNNNSSDIYGISNLDSWWPDINHMIKYYKLGFGKTTEYMNEEIRLGKISREEAAKIVREYDGKISKQKIQQFCKYLDISENFFWKHIKKNVNKKLFEIKDNSIQPRFKVGFDLNE